MTALILAARDKLRDSTLVLRTGGAERCALVLGMFALAMAHEPLRGPTLTALADAYLQVGVFVAATFAIFYWIEARWRVDTAAFLERHRAFELPIAAALGAMPGCGGAVMVITQFAMGRASFGAVVAVLTATMGDAAFLMLARKPQVAVLLMGAGFVAGTISGWVVNRLHGRDFLRVERPVTFLPEENPAPAPSWIWSLWGWIALPGLALGILALAQVDVDAWSHAAFGFELALAVGVVGGLLSIAMWALSPTQATHMAACRPDQNLVRRIALNTNFVTVWVVLGFLAFALFVPDDGVSRLFVNAPALLPLLAILVGFLPGCGPQIVVTTLYLGGMVPFSAQLGNAISNDGDALFPAIAISPRAAIVATLYTAVPALALGYGYLLLFE